jgi:hypothetical protein
MHIDKYQVSKANETKNYFFNLNISKQTWYIRNEFLQSFSMLTFILLLHTFVMICMLYILFYSSSYVSVLFHELFWV